MEPGAVQPERVYLDYSGFAPVDPRVLAVMRPFLEAGIGNPSARHSLGAEARESLDAARAKVARLCGGSPAGVIFTSSATEANNLAIRGVALRAREARGARVVLSSVEHISVVNACRELEKAGTALTFLPVDRDGSVDPEAVRGALTPETVLVSVGAASNEIGTLQPLAEIGRLTRAAGVPFHVDAVGAIGRVPLNAQTAGVDLLTLSGNDIYGPPGTGALWVRPGIKLLPQLLGGGQEGGLRSGTENLPSLVGLGVAAELMRTLAHEETTRLRSLRDRLLTGLVESVPNCRLTGSRTARLPHHVSVVLRGVKADSVLLDLDLMGIAASSGSPCSPLTQTPSHVLRALGCTAEEMAGSLCFTLGRWSTAADVEVVLERLPAIVSRLRSLALTLPR
jgi:cysteine desulfurase